MGNKRGQFFIAIAIVIILAIATLASVVTYAVVKTSPETLQSLSADLKEEGPRVIDYGIYNKEDIILLLNNFTDSQFAPYFLQKTDGANLILIYGNKTNLYGARYNTTSTGTILATIGGQTGVWNPRAPYSERLDIDISSLGNKVNVTIIDKNYEFELRDNEMFYFVMAQKKEGETYVEKNK